ncbi:RTA1 like protein-domain-containing protein [Gloeopeniophorella convolvens]|nr:RTA1 like protein-domain-containing protein [Gloeopeniophorella convolvens]
MVHIGPTPPPLNITLPFFPSEHDYPSGFIAKFSPYKYIPTAWTCVFYIAVFAISTILHAGQAIYLRLWWLLPSATFCGVLETVGWSARLWSSHNPLLRNPFIVEFCLLIISPTALVAANFIILGRIVQRLGTQYSRLNPTLYFRIFLSCDVISLIVQGIGGVIATSNDAHAKLGSHIALAGIVFQLASITLYVALAVEFLTRYKKDRPVSKDKNIEPRGIVDKRLKRMARAIGFMTALIFIRSIYRTIELAEGRSGKVSKSQWAFDVFDAAMISSAMYTLNACHPGMLLRGPNTVLMAPANETKALDAGLNSRDATISVEKESFTVGVGEVG